MFPDKDGRLLGQSFVFQNIFTFFSRSAILLELILNKVVSDMFRCVFLFCAHDGLRDTLIQSMVSDWQFYNLVIVVSAYLH